MRTRAFRYLSSIVVISSGTSFGCTNFDLPERITDTRVIGIRTEPAEILFSPLFLTPAAQRPPFFPLPSFDVDVEVFAFDPRLGSTTTTIQLCPEGSGDSSCRLFDPQEALAGLPEPARTEVAALLVPQSYDGDIAEDATPIGRITPNLFTYTFTPAVIDFLQPKNADGEPTASIFPLLPRFVVNIENHDVEDGSLTDVQAIGRTPPPPNAERAFKRIPIAVDLTSPDLPAEFRQTLADGLGVSLCEAPLPAGDDFVEGEAACLHPRVPNVNPALVGFRLEETDDPTLLTKETLFGDVPDLGLGSFVRANPGATIALTPMFRDGGVERYQVISFDIESSKIKILNREEDLACTWYFTRGSVDSALTALEFGDHLGVVWRLPQNAEPGERDSLILVVLDQRGGTSVAEVTVEYR